MSQSWNYSLWQAVYHKCIYADRKNKEQQSCDICCLNTSVRACSEGITYLADHFKPLCLCCGAEHFLGSLVRFSDLCFCLLLLFIYLFSVTAGMHR